MSTKVKTKSKTSYHQAGELAWHMWKLLGEKSKWQDDVDPLWSPTLLDRWEQTGLDYDDFRRIVVWALTENEFTAKNLRLARNPAKSLFNNQWDNVELFWDADMAGRKARERRSWLYGPCPRCDEKPAKGKQSDCTDCQLLAMKVDRLLKSAQNRMLVHTYSREGEKWCMVVEEPLSQNPNASAILQTKVKWDDVLDSLSDKLFEVENADKLAWLERIIDDERPEPTGRRFDVEEA